jgi:outer membrane protein OmpA-like peptidoglycan-associated protein
VIIKKTILLLALLTPVYLWGQDVDTSMHIKSIYFGGGSYYIDGEQLQELYDWLDGFENIEQYEVIIQSHTDNIGSVYYNKRLSEMRSSAVWQKLLEYPLVPEAMEIKNFGEYLPTYSNEIHMGRLKNRRADVILKPVSL